MHSYKHNVCGFTKVRHNSYLLVQWVVYHISIGVDHFYITEDCADKNDPTRFWLDFYKGLGFLSYISEQPWNNCTNHTPNSDRLLRELYDSMHQDCKWAICFDCDEYIWPSNEYIVNKYSPNPISPKNWFKYFMNDIANSKSLMYLQWWMSYHGGREKRAPGLLIDSYLYGRFDSRVTPNFNLTTLPSIGKHIARTSEVSYWEDNHIPVMKDGSHMQFEIHITNNRSDHDPSPFLGQIKGCKSPRLPIFLKHFRFISFEDVLEARGKNPFTAKGLVNEWYTTPRKKWLEYNVSHYKRCPPISDTYRQNISKVVVRHMKKYIRTYYTSVSRKVPSDAFHYLLNGLALP